MTAAQGLVDRFLGDELKALKEFSRGKLELSKDQLRTRLVVVNNVLMGCGSLLPFPGESEQETAREEEEVRHMASRVATDPVPLATAAPGTQAAARLTLEGRNVRQAVAEALFEVQKFVLVPGGGKEDDTKSLHSLVTAQQVRTF